MVIIKKPTDDVRPPHNKPVWQDINGYFKALFEENPDEVDKLYTPEALISDLMAYFGGKYDLETITAMCNNGYEQVQPGVYLFLRIDFILPKIIEKHFGKEVANGIA